MKYFILILTVLAVGVAGAVLTDRVQAQDEAVIEPGCSKACIAHGSVGLTSPSLGLLAQAGGGRGKWDRPPSIDDEEMGRRRKHLEQLRMLKMLELLDLREDQETEFLVMFKRMTDAMKELEKTKHELIEQLAGAVGEEPVDNDRIDGLLDRLFNIERERVETMLSHLDKLRDSLDPAQIAKVAIFQERFEAQMLDRLREFHQRRSGRSDRPGTP